MACIQKVADLNLGQDTDHHVWIFMAFLSPSRHMLGNYFN